jgi:glucose/mannose-6-phosphate isomerase
MMQEAIKNFATQFEFEPKVVNFDNLNKKTSFIVCGMGGSHLAADLLKRWKPDLDLTIHSDYSLPAMSEEKLKNSLLIFSSYSGNTEEVIDAFNHAKEKNLDMAVVTVGGKLLEMAEANNIPFVQMPNTGIQPRSALGFSIMGLVKLMGFEDGLQELKALATNLKPLEIENKGQELAEKLKDFVPVIYSSGLNKSIAYNWKIKFNETGKIPAFYNIFPELNHNEMTGLDIVDSTKHLSDKFYFIILADNDDHEKNQKRMAIVEELYQKRELKTEVIKLEGNNVFEKIFNSLLLADWAAVYIAEIYGLESEQVPMVEEFKDAIK